MLLIIESASHQWTRPEHSPAPRWTCPEPSPAPRWTRPEHFPAPWWTRPEQEEEEAEQEEEENSNPESSGLPRPAGGDSFQRILAVLGSAAHRQAEACPDGRVARTQSGVLQLAGKKKLVGRQWREEEEKIIRTLVERQESNLRYYFFQNSKKPT